MIYRRKTLNKQKKGKDVHEQLVKLSKENQYLHTKLECYEQQIQQLNIMKDKYKYKYKKIKAQFANNSCSENEFVSFKEQLPTKKQIFKEDNPYSLKRPNPDFATTKGDVGTVICKIRDSLCEFIEKISNVNKKLDKKTKNYNRKQVCYKLDFLAQKLDDIATLIHNKKDFMSSLRQSRFKSSSQSKKSVKKPGSLTPIKRTNSIMRNSKGDQYHEVNSLALSNKYSERKKERSYSESQSYWKILKEIGAELRDWKVELQEEDNFDQQ